MSLADELLADLEDDFIDDDLDGGRADDPMGDTLDEATGSSAKLYSSVRNMVKLADSTDLARIMVEIGKRQQDELNFTKCQIDGPVESHPEYKLVVEANNIAVEIDNDINICFKFARDKYNKRFPEMESLVSNSMDYLKTVRILGNNLTKVKNNEALQEFLTQATIMALSVTASTTQGKDLSDDEMAPIVDACEIAIELNNSKQKIYSFVESRMTFIAPNLTAICGASTAAKLLGCAGGLVNLMKIPSCNMKLLGRDRRNLAGFSTTTLQKAGFVEQCDLVTNTPPDLRNKAATLVANKCTLAARIDADHSYADGSMGVRFRDEIEKKLDKLQEPPPVKFVKPLPAPIEVSKKKRGGKRVRKMKERMAVTELRKQSNRMNFGEIEDDAYQADLGFTTGQMGKSATGRIRAAQIDEKTKVRISKTRQKDMQRQAQLYGGASTVRKQISGTASTIAFTPAQGLEINNPSAAEKRLNEANAKYFSNQSGFYSVKPPPQ